MKPYRKNNMDISVYSFDIEAEWLFEKTVTNQQARKNLLALEVYWDSVSLVFSTFVKSHPWKQ
jgi:hypothetical protein